VRLGNGDGSFAAPVSYPAGQHLYYVTVADLNGDGRQDLAVIDYDLCLVRILFGRGDGSFRLARSLTVPASPFAVVPQQGTKWMS
jgi:hypothetical protein